MLTLSLALAVLALGSGAAPPALDVPGFGQVAPRAPPGSPRRVVVLAAAAGPEADRLADALAAGGALVIPLDPARRAAGGAGCVYPAGDLEALAQQVQKRLGLPAYLRPALVGHGLGASYAYAALAQAPHGTFRGAVVLGLCPGRPLPFTLCRAGGPPPRRGPRGDVLPPWPGLEAPLAVVQGAEDRECPPAAARAFAARIPAATFTAVPGAGHRLAAGEGWEAAVEGALARLDGPAPAPSAAPAVTGLPVVEVPAAGQGRRLAVMITGDGGWVGLDKGVARGLVAAGIAVVGLDSLAYFWHRKTPEEAAAAVARIMAHYAAAWGRDEVILIGYSRGADVLPFVLGRLPPEARRRVRLAALLGPGTYADFEVHVVDLFASLRRGTSTSTLHAVEALGGAVRLLCVQGADERDTLCPAIAGRPEVTRVVLPGGHHFDRDYDKLARLIVEAVP